ncbi:MAG: NUDIX domain-containing protein [Acholeplasmatales bacterium]|nr:NUDIX domain-containing protein [Acholeplasmatales bacterium]
MEEHSCGVILYTDKLGKREYVLIMEPSGTYGFPKGHIRKGETDLDCALRECYEETGVKPEIIPGLKRTIRYNMAAKGRSKEVTYFVGKYNDEELNPQDSNIQSCKKYDMDVALNLLKFKQIKDILIETDYMLDIRGNN